MNERKNGSFASEYDYKMVDWSNPQKDIRHWEFFVRTLRQTIKTEIDLKCVPQSQVVGIGDINESVRNLLKALLKDGEFFQQEMKRSGKTLGKDMIMEALVIHGTEEQILRYLALGKFDESDIVKMLDLAMTFEGKWSQVPYYLAYLKKGDE
jgi:hypothetical protein